MKVYIAGKITGDPGYRDKFAAAEIQSFSCQTRRTAQARALRKHIVNTSGRRWNFGAINV